MKEQSADGRQLTREFKPPTSDTIFVGTRLDEAMGPPREGDEKGGGRRRAPTVSGPFLPTASVAVAVMYR